MCIRDSLRSQSPLFLLNLNPWCLLTVYSPNPISVSYTHLDVYKRQEQERIGTFHQGAAEVIATGKPVLIETKDLPRYPGANEGYNMPIFLKDELIGVVGIFGCEEQMLNVANLLKVYVTRCV